MHSIRMVILTLAVVSIVGCQKMTPSQPDQHQQGLPVANAQSGASVMEHVLVALKPDGRSARFDYRGTCEAPNSDVISFPPINLESSQETKNGLLRVQEMFRGNKDISVTEQPSGIIRIRVAGISGEILQTRIGHLALSRIAQYDPTEAIGAIVSASEVQSAMRHFNTRPAVLPGGLEQLPAKGMSHLDHSMENVTVDQALDRILGTFKGVVVYKECTRPGGAHLFSITFDGE